MDERQFNTFMNRLAEMLQGVRQYIGARYVPHFLNDPWNDTTQYEALDVVDNGMGTSYIAKKPVPAGTPLSDREFWFVYGSTSGAIINLQNQIDAIVNTTIPGINSEIEALSNQLEKSILVIGNSYVLYGCADKLKSTFAHSYQKTSGGAGFLAYTGHTDTFVTLLNDAVSDANIPKDDITDIIFVSAMGDSRALTAEGESNFTNDLTIALQQVQNIISTNFPNCKRTSITYAETRKVASFADSPYNSLFAMHRIFKLLCYQIGFDYLGWSGFNSLFVSAEIDSDNYHPSSVGAERIGQFIHDSYYGHCEYVTKKSSGTTGYALQANSVCTFIAYLTPDHINFNVRYSQLTAGTVAIGAGDLFLTTSGLPIPLPKPSSNIDFIGTVKSLANYSKICDVILTLQGNANGIAILINSNAISTSVASNTNVLCDCLCSVCYVV